MSTSSQAELVQAARENPFRFFLLSEVAAMFDFGRDTMTALVSAGAPVTARKMNPGLLLKWLEGNSEKVGKIREE